MKYLFGIIEEVQVEQLRSRLRQIRRVITETLEIETLKSLAYRFGITDTVRYAETVGLGFKFGINHTLNAVEEALAELHASG